jgi:L-ascorbate metabolism protein UlaG (beta-lactamase superfamily)
MKSSLRISLGLGLAACVLCCENQAGKPPGAAPPAAAPSNPAPAPSNPVGGTAASARAPASAIADTFTTELGALHVVPIKHASVRLELGAETIYVDPADASLFDGAKPGTLVLITDIHGDHFDPAALAKVVGPNTTVIAPSVVAEKYPSAKVLKNGEHQEQHGIGIEAIPMYNEKRGPAAGQLYHDKGRGNGYVLSFGKTRVYLSGDTECTAEMRALKAIDVAFVCMNLPYTMTPEEAATCVNAFHPKVVYPYHYHGSDLQAFQKAVTAPGVEVRLREWYPTQ